MAGEAAFEVTVLVVMNGIGLFLVPDVETGDKVDDEAEDVELHHTSYVSPFAREIESTNLQINLLSLVLQSKNITAESCKHRGLSGHRIVVPTSWFHRNKFKLSEVYEYEKLNKTK